jgi:hypothetical protein
MMGKHSSPLATTPTFKRRSFSDLLDFTIALPFEHEQPAHSRQPAAGNALTIHVRPLFSFKTVRISASLAISQTSEVYFNDITETVQRELKKYY